MTGSLRKWPAVALAAASLAAAPRARASAPRIVEIAARRFAFSPGEIVLLRGKPVTLRLTSRDVTHGFYQKALGIDAIIEPGKVTDVTITPDKVGRFATICDHFCGSGHGGMKMSIVVEEPGTGAAP